MCINPLLTATRHVWSVSKLFSFMLAFSLILTGCDSGIFDNHTDEKLAEHLKKVKEKFEPGPPQLFVSGLMGTSGSAIGPGGALFVTEGMTGKVLRIDPKTGVISAYASGLPMSFDYVGIGGAYDIAFIGSTAYVLVSLIGSDVGGTEAVGIYRMDSPDTYTIIADIGAWSAANPPATDYFLSQGVQYAIQNYKGGFLVSDGHHNRVLKVSTAGDISEFKAFGNVVPTGMALWGNTVFLAETGEGNVDSPNNGKVVSFSSNSPDVNLEASDAPMVVDVEFNKGRSLFALSQGVWDGAAPGSPANPNTGSLLKVRKDGTFSTVSEGLDRPTSLEFINNKAYIITLTGEVWTVDNVW